MPNSTPAPPTGQTVPRPLLVAGGIGCGCTATLSLCAIIALFTLVIGPAVRQQTVETTTPLPTPAAAASTSAPPAPTRPAATPTPAAAPPTAPAAPPTATPAPPTAEPPALRRVTPTAPPPTPIRRPRPVELPVPTEQISVSGTRIGVLGLSRLDDDGRLVVDELGTTVFRGRLSGIGAAFTLERGPPTGTLELAGVWVARMGERVTPLADPAMLEVSVLDEGQPLLFRLTFRAGSMPGGEYAFGLFTVQHGEIDQLLKRLDFTVE